jgi:phenylacetate-CoA ligase
MTPWIVRKLVLPLTERARGGRFRETLAELERQQWLDAEALRELQLRKLRRILDHCARNVPYYQRLFRTHGFDPGGVRRLEDLAQLPPLTKADLQSSGRELRATNLTDGDFLRNQSGGSTGVVTHFFLDPRCADYARAAQFRYYRWIGVDFGDRQALVWGAPINLRQARWLKRRLRNFFLNKLFLDANDLTEATIDGYLDTLRRYRPAIVVGYATGLWFVAERLLARGLRLPSVRGVVSTAELLPPQKRGVIERAFGVKVYDRYGCGEMKDIAQECGESAHSHVNADNVLVEYLDGDRPVPPGEVGEIVATNLNNIAMPLLRYRLGDLGHSVEERCPCGRGLPLMSVVKGRLYDVLTLPSGRRVHAALVNHIMYGHAGIQKYQMVQETPTRLVCRILRAPEFTTDILTRIREDVQKHLGAEVDIDFEFPEHIAPSPSGKHRFIYSKVAAGAAGAATGADR